MKYFSVSGRNLAEFYEILLAFFQKLISFFQKPRRHHFPNIDRQQDP